jgi:predicted DNA-binding protein
MEDFPMSPTSIKSTSTGQVIDEEEKVTRVQVTLPKEMADRMERISKPELDPPSRTWWVLKAIEAYIIKAEKR